MKIAVVYHRDSKNVINLFGIRACIGLALGRGFGATGLVGGAPAFAQRPYVLRPASGGALSHLVHKFCASRVAWRWRRR